ncbi:MAG TPA: response regulator [Thermosynechococcaceae cyanobacterium]
MGQSLNLSGLKILVVEHDPDNLMLYTILLEDAGAEVLATASVPEALTVLAEVTPDVLISEIILPGEDGYSLIRQVKALEAQVQKQIPAIVVSGSVQKDDDPEALKAGFQKCLLKPVNLNHLLRTIGRLVYDRLQSERGKQKPTVIAFLPQTKLLGQGNFGQLRSALKSRSQLTW